MKEKQIRGVQAINSKKFAAYKQRIIAQLIDMHALYGPEALAEQAVPSYIHSNPLIRELFWRRVWTVINCLKGMEVSRALDFGCGAGVMLPFLTAYAQDIVAFDVDPTAAQEMIQRLALSNISLISEYRALKSLPAKSFDAILALDVLEHVDDLEEVCVLFRDLLKPQGTVIVSGPTESWLYRLGRMIAGYKRHFHKRDIYAIERTLGQYFCVQRVMRLYPGVTFFRISVWKLA